MHPKDVPDKQFATRDAGPPATPGAQTPRAPRGETVGLPAGPPPAESPLGDYVRELQQEFEEQEEKATLRP